MPRLPPFIRLLIVCSAFVTAACSDKPAVSIGQSVTPQPLAETPAEAQAPLSPTKPEAADVPATSPDDSVPDKAPSGVPANPVLSDEPAIPPLTLDQGVTLTVNSSGTPTGSQLSDGELIVLDGSASSSSAGDIVSYAWTQVEDGAPRVTLLQATSAKASFVATERINQTPMAFELTVTDASDNRAKNTFRYNWLVAPVTGPTASASVMASVISGELIQLDGSATQAGSSPIKQQQWTQVSGPGSQVIIYPDSELALVVAPFVIAETNYSFRLEVIDESGATDSSTVDVVVKANGRCPSCTGQQAAALAIGGRMQLGATSDFIAESSNSLYLADKIGQQLVHANPSSHEILSVYGLSGEPAELEHVVATNSIYIANKNLSLIDRVRLDSGTTQTIEVAGPVGGLTSNADRLYFSVADESGGYHLFSLGNDNLPRSHGVIEGGDQLLHNPVLNEIVAVAPGESIADVHRYSIGASTNAVKLQSTDRLAAVVHSLDFSADGTRLAVASEIFGDEPGGAVVDTIATDLEDLFGVWFSAGVPLTAEFTESGKYLLVSDGNQLSLFDATDYSQSLLQLDMPACSIGLDKLSQAKISEDDAFMFAKLECGTDGELVELIFHQLP